MSPSKPFWVQSATVDGPVPPCELSRLISRKAPGPTFCRSSVVCWFQQGQPGPLSIGCLTSTAIGAAYLTFAGTPARAVAFAWTFTEESPNTFMKKDGAVL